MAGRQKEKRTVLAKVGLPVSRLLVPVAVGVAREVAALLSLDENDRAQLQMAVEEGFCNGVDHYSGPTDNDDRVHLEFSVEEDRLVVSIREMGIPFNHDEAERYAPDSLESMEKGGLGMLLMEHTMDSVELFVHGRSGKETRLTKRLRYGALPEELVSRGRRKRGKDRPTVKRPIVRPAQMDELAEITRLAWRCYGYTQEELLYDLEQLTAKVRSGAFKPVVGFDPESGAMIGHAGLKYHEPNARVPELGLAFVDPGYRCPRMTGKLAEAIFELSRSNGDQGVFDCSVTTHTFSQKAMQHHFGSRPCCIMLGIAAQGMQARELATVRQEKGSVVNHYQAFDRSESVVYPPARHRGMIEEVYSWLELPRVMKEPSGSPAEAATSLSAFPLPDELNVAFIIVNTVGSDAREHFAEAFKTFRAERKDAVYAFLPLGSPHSPDLVEELELFGFFFAGIMPHVHGGDDRILLQWLDIHIDLDKVRVYGDMSRKLLAYVGSEKERVEGR